MHLQVWIMSNQWPDRLSPLGYGPRRRGDFSARVVGIETIKQALNDFYAKFPELGC